jgi:hypothetical protein
MDCLVTFSASIEEAGAVVEYLSAYVVPADIEDHLEAETSFEVTCLEPVEER